MRVLEEQEIAQVNGGIAPFIAVAASFATHHAVRTVGQYILSRGLTTYGIYTAAKWEKSK